MKYTQLLLFLRQHSYQEVHPIHECGDFSVHGDTITWWPVTSTSPWRYHFFGEDLERCEIFTSEQWISEPEGPLPEPNELATEHGTVRPGEYVVHPHHGVGVFRSRLTRTVDEGERGFVNLEYAGNDRLLYPYDRVGELMPYIGSRHPRLTRLNSKVWQHTKERVQRDLIGIARELLKVYASRQMSERAPYRSTSTWSDHLATSAGFALTEDQARAMGEIRHDLEQVPHPMDRLICGDVGFGKTELALRTAAQVLEAGKQVAFIAPTTVLAEQHYALIRQRFAELPVRTAHLSRLTVDEDKQTIAGLCEGTIEMVVGTHRVLSKSVQFRDLGLLIIDEEQKFGVAQKELLKSVRPNIDVLSLSATPIPRTLSMSMSGLRGLSILRTPPAGRRPVQTNIQDFTSSRLQKALTAELKRGGQVYVVHNRVQSLGLVRQVVLEQLEQAGFTPRLYEESEEGEGCRVAIAHGQMDERVMARTMSDFLAGTISVLVASSIVEHGLDSPGANTLIVLHSEWFGLSDLYQLRGRVGRRQIQAHAYFFLGGIERDRYEVTLEAVQLSEVARKRLEALQEADELGSGWSVALRDLEIRGGGNILGHEQHGSMEAIGLLLYAQLLQEEIGRQARMLGLPVFHHKAS